ncbi:endonuclease [Thalassobaculum fulvum]|uniref:Endonuclease n=1 Tax=Thalassobaculum fulvum TaxID=1633335 RepID=A0A918XV95_9PROT|nr:GIY-YIG nuclease family protein [Thalassobaculum fulvum]GHD55495.1 endonuclease [Thalassobaculum fulvum]
MARTLRPCVYILASKRNGTLYVGVTGDLLRRVWVHREQPSGFCARYRVDRLVWFEPHLDMAAAILRETRLKGWRRAWKIALIEQANPDWRDLYPDLV